LLTKRKITLLDPTTWDDKNDSYFLMKYQIKHSLKTVLALCFARNRETYHHWRVFADGSSGVCVRFDRTRLLRAVRKNPEVIYRDIEYLPLSQLPKTLKAGDLPFLKRRPYKPESEFRLLYQSRTRGRKFFDIPIPLSCIDQISLSPWMPDAFKRRVINTIKKIKGCDRLKVTRSTLIDNERWRKAGDGAEIQKA
jgi:hypothetical protein